MTLATKTDLPQPLLTPSQLTTPLGVPVLSIVVVNYRQWRRCTGWLKPLLESEAIRRGRAEIVVIDNAAEPSKHRRQLRKASDISIRVFRRNHGFAKGVNEGVRLSRAKWFLLLNPDVSLPPGFLDSAISMIDRWTHVPRAGIIGCRLHDSDGTIQGSAGKDPTLFRLLNGLLKPRPRRKCRPLNVSAPVEVPWVTGCGMLIRRDCFEAIRGFDAGYFLYYEDADLCRRARLAGWSVWHEPELAIHHHRPLHQRKAPARLRLMTRHALLIYAARHWPKWQFRLTCRLATLDARVRAWWSRRRGKKRAARIYSKLQAIIQDIRIGAFERAYRKVWRVAQGPGRRHERPRKPR